MRTIYSTDMVAHLWANQSQPEARNGSGHRANFYFRGPVIYSYRESWPVAILSPWQDADGRRVVFLNSAHYSVTTSKHERATRDALRGHPVRIIECPQGLPGHSGADRLARGDESGLASIVRALGELARGTLDRFAGRRAEWAADSDLREARDLYAAADVLAALPKRAKDRATVRAEFGDRIPLGDAASVRAELKARAVAAELTMAAKLAAAHWKGARDATRPAWARLDAATDAAKRAAAVARLVKRTGAARPRGVPTVKQAREYAAAMRPRAALEWGIRNAEGARGRRRALVEHMAMIRRAATVARQNAGAASAIRESAAKNARQIVADVNEPRFRAVRNGLDTLGKYGVLMAADYSRHPLFPALAAMGANPGPYRARAVAALRDLRAALRELDEAARAAGPRLDRMRDRERLQDAARALTATLAEARYVTGRGPAPFWLAASPYPRRKSPADILGELERDAAHYSRTWNETAEDLRGGLPGIGSPLTDEIRGLLADRARLRLQETADRVRTFYRHALALRDSAAYSAGLARPFTARDTRREALNAANSARAMLVEIEQQAARAEIASPLDASEVSDIRALFDLCETDLHEAHAMCAAMSQDEIAAAWRRGDEAAARALRGGPRFRLDGAEIVSTLGARVSVDAGARLWRLIRAVVARGEARTWEWGAGPAIGPFRVQSIGADGSARVGCHNIEAREARAFAEYMQWPPFGTAGETDGAADSCAD